MAFSMSASGIHYPREYSAVSVPQWTTESCGCSLIMIDIS